MNNTIKEVRVRGIPSRQEVLVCATEYDGDELVSGCEYRVDTSDQHGTVEDIVVYETNKWVDRGYKLIGRSRILNWRPGVDHGFGVVFDQK